MTNGVKTFDEIEQEGYDSFNPLGSIKNPYSNDPEKKKAFIKGYIKASDEFGKEETLFDCD